MSTGEGCPHSRKYRSAASLTAPLTGVRRFARRTSRRHLSSTLLAMATLLVISQGLVPSMLASPVPAAMYASAMAPSPTVTLGENRGPVGRAITVAATGFGGGETVDIRWRSAAANPLTSVRASSTGTFSTPVTIPDTPLGQHGVIVTGRTTTGQVTALYTVTPSLSRVPAEGAPWTRILITAKGFGANEDVRLNWLSESGTVLGTVRTSSAGTGQITITMPNGQPGWNDYTGYGLTSRARAWGALRILSSTELSPTAAAPGTTVQMTARGYPPGEQATVTWNANSSSAGSTLCRGTIAWNGTLVCRFAVPGVGAGVYPVRVTASGGTSLASDLTVTGPASAAIAPGSGAVGTNVTITAGGFAANETLNVSWDTGISPRSVRASAQGTIQIQATVPQLATGSHTVRVRGVSSGRAASAPFSVTTTPAAGTTSRVSEGVYNVYATREGLVGGTTSSGHRIVTDDYFVSLPACTTTNCPGGPYWGNMTNCGSKCYIKVVNPQTNSCRVEPILDTGPWFRVDDWWNSTSTRYLNSLASNPNRLAQGYTGADAARNGLDVGYGVSANGIGHDDTGTSAGRPIREVGNRSAIDIADGTWKNLGLTSDGIGSRVTVHMLWQTGADPAVQAQACGHPLNQRPGQDPVVTNPPATANPSFSGAALAPTASSGSSNGSGSAYARDGRWSTAWYAQTNPSSGFFIIDYGQVRQLTGVRWGFNATGYADQFTIETSVDKQTWTRVGTFGNAPRYAWYGVALGHQGRYLRVTFANPNADVKIGYMAEIQLFGTAGTAADPTPIGGSNPQFSGAPLRIVASTGSAGSNASTRAHDGSADTNWATISTTTPTQAILTLDTGRSQALTGIRWKYGVSGSADQMRLQVSSDGSTWTQLVTTSNRAAGTWEGWRTSTTTRYVRLVFDNPNRDAALGYVAEVEVWGPTTTFAAAQAMPTEAMPAQGKTEVAAARTPVSTTPTPTPAALPPRAEPTSAQAEDPARTPLPNEQDRKVTTPGLVESPPADETPVTAAPTPSPSATTEPVAPEVPEVTEATPTASLPSETPPPSPDPTPTLMPTETVATATEVSPAPTEVVTTGEGYIVTGAEGANCRVAPGANQEIISPLLDDGTLVLTIGEPAGGWQEVICNGQNGYVFAELISDTPPTQTTGPTEPTGPVETEAPLEPGSDPDTTPDGAEGEIDAPDASDETPTPAPTAIEERVSREIVIVVAEDTSVAEADPLAAQSPDAMLTLPAGGDSGALAVLTFPIEGVDAGTVVDARLVITGAGEKSGEGGQLRAIDGIWFDEASTTWNDVVNAGGEDGPGIGWIEPGGETEIDVTGIVSVDSVVSFVIEGTPAQPVSIASTESGSPAYLVITVEEWIVPAAE